MNKSLKFFVGAFLIFMMASCATIFSGKSQKVTITSQPSGARIFQDGKDLMAITPAEVKIRRKKKTTITLQKDGYEDATLKPKSKVNVGSFVVGNLVLGGVPGWLIDWGTGAMWKYDKNLSSILSPVEDNESVPVPMISQERVTRDNAGGTELERTIIRWYIDSEPRGARVFWRVISSVPSEVKNTNETYLGSTPYEETRPFNILGLTYDNSRDVTIEITIRKAGYMDQVKRFNVRQAIDQQEISSFYDLVAK